MSPETTEALRRDLERHEQEIKNLWDRKASVRDIEQVGKDFESLTEEVRSLRRTIIGFALTVALSALGIMGAVLSAGAHP